MLTFLTPNGWCQPTVQQLADAMRISEAKARARMQRLRDFAWQGQALVTETKRESGLDSYALSPEVIGLQPDAVEPAPDASTLPRLAGREAVIALSLAKYARPRAEVEQEIAERMEWKEQGVGPDALLRRKLLGVAGLLREHVDLLLERYPLERIEQQLEWLPYRNAKSPARFLMAAIENDYDPPPLVRLQPAFAPSDASQEEPHGLEEAPGRALPAQDQDEYIRETTESAGQLEMSATTVAHDE